MNGLTDSDGYDAIDLVARLLYPSNPGYRRRCKYASHKGCTCYYFDWNKKVKQRRRKAARLAEKARLRRAGREQG